MTEVNWTTRRFPRTLEEAFPDGPTYAASVEIYRKHFTLDTFNIWLCIFGCGVLCGAMLAKGIMG